MLFKPFRWSFYWRMAVVAFLSGELGGGANFRGVGNFPMERGRHGGSSEFLGSLPWHLPGSLSVTDWILIGAVAAFAFFAVLLIFLYIASIFRFILFDSVLSGNCSIRANWSRRQREGRKYFQWSLIVMVISFSTLIVVFGTPVLFAWSAGIFANASKHIALLVLSGIVLFFLLVIFLLAAGAIHIIGRDMLLPMFAFEDISIGDAWERVKQMVTADKGGYAGYFGMCLLVAIGVGLIFGIIAIIVVVILAIPAVLIGAVVFGILTATGWNPVTIAFAVILGMIALVALLFVVGLIYVPAVIFRQNYGMYFFGARYRPLMPYMYPPSPMPPPHTPPPEPAPA